MELEVDRVGLQHCFVNLPRSLLEILLEGSHFPSFPVVLEMKYPKNSGDTMTSFIAWNGGASSSTRLEVPEALAECIDLPPGARVRVRLRGDVLSAETIVLEPSGADDWEILELNAAYLENHILSRVGVVFEGLQFPVWATGHVVVTLRVISTSPKGIVKLVPGAELVIAPRKRALDTTERSDDETKESLPSETMQSPQSQAWLRVQELDPSFTQRLDLKGIICSTTPATVVFVSPDTAKAIPFEDGQLVTLRSGESQGWRTSSPLSGGHSDQETLHDGFSHEPEDSDLDRNDDELQRRDIIVILKFWEGVAAGHVMVALPLRLLIGVVIHMPVYLQSIAPMGIPQPSSVLLSPVLFRPLEDKKGPDGAEELDTAAISKRFQQGKGEIQSKKGANGNWRGHRYLFEAGKGSQNEGALSDGLLNSLVTLLKSWVDAQVAFSKRTETEGGSVGVVVSSETVLHVCIGSSSDHETQEARTLSHKFAENSGMPEVFTTASPRLRSHCRNFLFLLNACGSSRNGRQQRVDARLPYSKDPLPPCYFLKTEALVQSTAPPDLAASDSGEVIAVQQGAPRHLACIHGSNLEVVEGPVLNSLTWLEEAARASFSRLELLLCPAIRQKLKLLGTPVPGSVLLHGPPACGKTLLALALARELQNDPRVLSHRVLIRCSDLVGEQATFIRGVLEDAIREATTCSPSLVILDDLDALLPASESGGSEPDVAVLHIAEFLADLMDICQGRRSNEFRSAGIAFLAVARTPMGLPACLRFSGRFDFHVEVANPAASQRAAVLSEVVASRGLRCAPAVSAKAAESCDGADVSDLELLVDRAVHAATSRFLAQTSDRVPSKAALAMDVARVPANADQQDLGDRFGHQHREKAITRRTESFELLAQDFRLALKDFTPLSVRGTTNAHQAKIGWEDVGGLYETRMSLQEMLEMPVKYSRLFEQAPLRLRTGVLLYGPPGCGKTYIVAAAASACALRLISVKGPELLNKYIGASEQGVRDVFARATAAAPCILFFDEFDAIAPQRGHDNTGVTDRVVNQLLTELDGVEALKGVFVVAATSRPDLLDAALLRPGRLDRLLLCDFPSSTERREILEILAQKLPMTDDIDLDQVASMTEGFSGADLQAVLSDAQLESVHSFLESKPDPQDTEKRKPTVSMVQLTETVSKARPSVGVVERQRLYSIYETFMGSRRSLPSKRDVKGKRATLA